MHEVVRLVIVISTLILFPSCGPHTKKNKKAAFQKAAFLPSQIQSQIDIHQDVLELEAKLTDIPTLIGSRTISIRQISEQPQQLRLELECNQSLVEVDAFYAEQMLYNGWQQVAIIKDESEIMHVYKKPSKMCIVTIKQASSKHTQISLAISDISNEL